MSNAYEEPWVAYLYNNHSYHVHTNYGRLIALVLGDDMAQKKKHADLIAAAPELLDELKAALAIVEECDPETVRIYAPRMREVIAKATGQAKP